MRGTFATHMGAVYTNMNMNMRGKVEATEKESALCEYIYEERWGAGVETQKNVRGEIWGWGRVPFNEPYAPSLSAIYDGA